MSTSSVAFGGTMVAEDISCTITGPSSFIPAARSPRCQTGVSTIPTWANQALRDPFGLPPVVAISASRGGLATRPMARRRRLTSSTGSFGTL